MKVSSGKLSPYSKEAVGGLNLGTPILGKQRLDFFSLKYLFTYLFIVFLFSNIVCWKKVAVAEAKDSAPDKASAPVPNVRKTGNGENIGYVKGY